MKKKLLCDNIKTIRKQLKHQILNSTALIGHETEQTEVYELIKSTVENGESNSALLIGPRGVGKTTLINSVLSQLSQVVSMETEAVVVHLNGLLHISDHLALNSINLQLHLETVVDGKVFGSFAENFAFLLASLKAGERTTAKSIIFILDEFDLFCSHQNQTLIYNLFDISQSPQTPVCVIGITSRLDVIGLLEKRVKSRFSHRQIFLFHCQPTKTADDGDINQQSILIRIIQEHLTLHSNKNNNKAISTTCRNEWNQSIGDVLKDPRFQQLLDRFTQIDLSYATVKNLIYSIVCQLTNRADQYLITVEKFAEIFKLFEEDDTVKVLMDLSVLELCLIIAMQHHVEIYDQTTMNFQMIYTRFAKFTNNSNSSCMQSTSKTIVMKAFERLENLQLIAVQQARNNGITQKEYQLFKFLVLPNQLKEALKRIPRLPVEVTQWAAQNFTEAN